MRMMFLGRCGKPRGKEGHRLLDPASSGQRLLRERLSKNNELPVSRIHREDPSLYWVMQFFTAYSLVPFTSTSFIALLLLPMFTTRWH